MTVFTASTYNIRTWGCQMNEADSRRLASALEKLGLRHEDDVVILGEVLEEQA